MEILRVLLYSFKLMERAITSCVYLWLAFTVSRESRAAPAPDGNAELAASIQKWRLDSQLDFLRVLFFCFWLACRAFSCFRHDFICVSNVLLVLWCCLANADSFLCHVSNCYAANSILTSASLSRPLANI